MSIPWSEVRLKIYRLDFSGSDWCRSPWILLFECHFGAIHIIFQIPGAQLESWIFFVCSTDSYSICLCQSSQPFLLSILCPLFSCINLERSPSSIPLPKTFRNCALSFLFQSNFPLFPGQFLTLLPSHCLFAFGANFPTFLQQRNTPEHEIPDLRSGVTLGGNTNDCHYHLPKQVFR